ncbi:MULTISPECIES: SLAP domain-containing protein [Lactobacillus]|uniref:SLAP domain-containing protein n=1 Tax=Lactobacillus TaxID=1578 RepID=UPI0018DE689D|nr:MULTISPECIES: SLAP domain-containing protein [Lactobacillus]MBI0033651.1 SLAP domain-containing protein [Lactobacillus sp. M0396]MBI0120987.1 SLAP domain-containing protein [Lactobacillus sp. M0398]MBI0123134.1 SLAP domain-containing protein [Lactobacillus sp. W8174]MBI0135302.1 SLAP domain-containing protein [Lactobacillus sp. W8173]
MRKKKLFISIAAGILAATSISTVAIDGYQAHAAQTTNQDEDENQEVLTLNHRTRIYNKKGKKVYSYLRANGLLQKGSSIQYAGKVQTTTDAMAERYSFHDINWNWFYLPYVTIKGKEYYNIGHGGYIKVVNVAKINGNDLYTNEASVTTKLWSTQTKIPLYDNQGKQLDKYLSGGQKIVLDKETNSEEFGPKRINTPPAIQKLYRIKGTDEFIGNVYIKTTPRQLLPFYSVFTQVYAVNDAKYYDKDGKAFTGTLLRKGTSVSVSTAIKIINPDSKKEELYYQQADNPRCFFKASDIKYLAGPKLSEPNK